MVEGSRGCLVFGGDISLSQRLFLSATISAAHSCFPDRKQKNHQKKLLSCQFAGKRVKMQKHAENLLKTASYRMNIDSEDKRSRI